VSDPSIGRRLVLASLVTILALSLALALLPGASASAAVRYGRPLAVGLACLLVWQGRSWARWLLVLLGLGIILAGPIAMGNGLSPWTSRGAVFWLASILYVASLAILFASRSARAFQMSAAQRGSRPPTGEAGA
jgi:hypothetical protein